MLQVMYFNLLKLISQRYINTKSENGAVTGVGQVGHSPQAFAFHVLQLTEIKLSEVHRYKK
jgi:hypothetical protein